MFRSILVPLDGSSPPEEVLAASRALGPDATLILLCVVPSPRARYALQRRHTALRDLRALIGRLTAEGIPCEGLLTEGQAGGAILRTAAEVEPDLIAMGTRGRTGVSRLLSGSVAEWVLRSTRWPLLLVNRARAKAPAVAPRRLLVPHDGSDVADAVLPLVSELAQAHRAEVTLLRVEASLARSEGSSATALWEPREVEASLADAWARLKERGVEVVRVRAALGNVVAEILRASREADLLLMATHGRTGLPRLWFGSVAEHVARYAACPVLAARVVAPTPVAAVL
jgi:nucleotide-binding universal stress UspA family protein